MRHYIVEIWYADTNETCIGPFFETSRAKCWKNHTKYARLLEIKTQIISITRIYSQQLNLSTN